VCKDGILAPETVQVGELSVIDFPITDLFDDSLCLLWLERHLHPNRFVCQCCGSANRPLFRRQGHSDAERCRVCDGYSTLLSATTFEGSPKRPALFVLLLRGSSKGEAAAGLARQLQLSRQTLHRCRQQIKANLNQSAPTEMMQGTTFEVDQLYQNAGGK
jgi:hypothetical protein